jgi:hypothetical protein
MYVFLHSFPYPHTHIYIYIHIYIFFQHIGSQGSPHMYEKFIVRDSARMQEVLDSIAKVAADGDPEQLDLIEKATGLIYDPHGMLFDKDLAGIVDLADAVYADLAHCLLASGGVAQYHINQFVLKITSSTEVTLQDLDRFASNITLPANTSKLTKTWFRDRVVLKESSHARAFASEVSAAVTIIGMFVDMVLIHADVLDAEIQCFKYLQELLHHIGKGTYEHSHPALEACRKHHQCFLSLYPLCATPKLHYTWHAILSWIKFGVLVTCLGAEAEHRLPKRIMHNAYRNCTKTAMTYWLHSFLDNLGDPTTFAPTHLPLDAKQCDHTVAIGRHIANIIMHANSIATPVGTLYKGDLLHWSGRSHCLGVAKLFLMVRMSGTVKFIAVVVQYLPSVFNGLWEPGQLCCVNAAIVQDAVPFARDGEYLRPQKL